MKYKIPSMNCYHSSLNRNTNAIQSLHKKLDGMLQTLEPITAEIEATIVQYIVVVFLGELQDFE